MSLLKTKPPLSEGGIIPLSYGGVDTHAHLDLKAFEEDLPEVLERAKKSGIAHIGNIFLGVEAWEKGKELFKEHPEVFFILGIHPSDAGTYTLKERAGIFSAFKLDPKIKALGEIGLDFYWDKHPRDIQYSTFIDQLHLARELDVPVIIHSRDAFDETVEVLKNEGFYQYPLLWHCFGGGERQAEILVEAGWHISIPGPVTFPKNKDLRSALSIIPLDKLVIETDCPFLAPTPFRGKRNEPAYITLTLREIANYLEIEPNELFTSLGDNANRFFRLDI